MGVRSLRNILVAARAPDQVRSVAADIRRLLRVRHRIDPASAADDFRVRTLEEMVALRTQTSRTRSALLAGVAAVSLIVLVSNPPRRPNRSHRRPAL